LLRRRKLRPSLRLAAALRRRIAARGGNFTARLRRAKLPHAMREQAKTLHFAKTLFSPNPPALSPRGKGARDAVRPLDNAAKVCYHISAG